VPRALLALTTLATLSACGATAVIDPSAASSAPATIERRVNQAFGGFTWWIEVDSANALLRIRCEQVNGPRVGNPCSGIPTTRTRQLTTAELRQLFQATREGEFLALKAEYDMSGTFVDGPAYSIRVVRNGGERQIRWSDAQRPLPAALKSLSDALLRLGGFEP
jgi:hypothetical protein